MRLTRRVTDTRFEAAPAPVRHLMPTGDIDPDQSLGWLRRLAPVLRRHQGTVVRSLLLALLAIAVQTAVPALTGRIIDDAIGAQKVSLLPMALGLVGLGIARGFLAYSYRYGLYSMAYKIDFDLRALMYAHLTKLSFGYYDRTQSGQIISRANSDIKSVQLYLALGPLLATSVVGFGVALVVMCSISIPLTLVAVAPLPFVYLAGVSLRNRIFPLSWIIQARTADIVTIVDENVTGVRVVKSFAAEEQQIDKMAGAARRLRWANVEQADARSRWAPLLENLPRVGLVAVLIYGGWLAIGGSVSIGDIVAFNSYILVLQIPFRLAGFFMILGQRARASAGRIFEVLDEQPEIVDPPDAVELVEPAGWLSFHDVSFGYGDGPGVLRHLDLEIPAGQSVAIVGRTGSGKSTVARLLPRFYDVRSGEVAIDGHDVRSLTLASLRHAVGVVLDEPFLFSASLRDNIAYARPDATFDEIRDAAEAAQAHDFIDSLPDGYDTVIGERGYTLSGGQRQRVAIARTILANPPVLVLDDATSAIDVHVEESIHRALRTLMTGRTTIVIAHRLSTIALADRVVLIADGRIIADGTHTGLLASEPRYAEVLASVEDHADILTGGVLTDGVLTDDVLTEDVLTDDVLTGDERDTAGLRP